MSHSRWAAVATSLKLSIDDVHLFLTVTRSLNIQDWASLVLRFTPALLESVATSSAPLQIRGERFSKVVSHFRFGNIYKLTSRDRTDLADALVLQLASQHATPRLLEVGVSDGSSALSLLRQKGRFLEIILSDRHNMFYKKSIPGGWLFYDNDKKLNTLKFLIFSLDLSILDKRGGPKLTAIETTNPVLRDEFGIHSIQRFDMFSDVLAHQAQIIKCANLLNRSYFSDEEIHRAARNLARSLCENGHLVVSQNHETYEGGEAAFVLRKTQGTLRLVEALRGHLAEPLFRAPLPCLDEPSSPSGSDN